MRSHIKKRLEYLSYGELAELRSLTPHVERDDVELLEAAGVPEFDERLRDWQDISQARTPFGQ